MPITAKPQAFTTDEKFSKALEVLSTIRNPVDAAFLRNFMLELCRRYIEKNDELSQYTSPAVTKMNKYETEYMERVIIELGPSE